MPTAPTLSVIIPYFNAEATIVDTLKSLAAQTLTDIELIAVDDGSNDNSAKLVTAFSTSNPQIRCIKIHHTENRGSAAAFNSGLAVATGRYVIKCDADDTVSPDFYATIIRASQPTDASTRPADIILSGITRFDGKRHIALKIAPPLSLNSMPIDTLHFSLVNKAIQRNFLISNNIRAYEGIDCWEDLTIVAKTLACNPTIAIADTCGYQYRDPIRRNSLSRGDTQRILSQRIAATKKICLWLTDHRLLQRYDRFVTNIKFHAKIKYLSTRPRALRMWRDTFPEVNSRIGEINGLPAIYRMLFRLAAQLR